jgi:hypothetical protein
MKLITKTLYVVMIAHLTQCMDTTQEKQASVSSLKDLATLSFINAYNPVNQNVTVAQLESLKEQTETLNDDLHEHVRDTIIKEKYDILEDN